MAAAGGKIRFPEEYGTHTEKYLPLADHARKQFEEAFRGAEQVQQEKEAGGK